MSKIAQEISSLPGFFGSKGSSVDDIAAAEGRLEVTFAQDYREYLSSFGIASANAHELTGLIESHRLNVVVVTEAERNRNNHVPADWYVIEDMGFDGAIAWQDTSGNIYRSLGNQVPKIIATNLLDYLKQ